MCPTRSSSRSSRASHGPTGAPLSRKTPIALALSALAFTFSACGDAVPTSADFPAILAEAARADKKPASGGSPARRAVRESLRQWLEAEGKYSTALGSLFWRPEVNGYLFRDESYVGGTFPLSVAGVLREALLLEARYLAELNGFRELLATNIAKSSVSAQQRSDVVAEIAGAFETRWKPIATAVERHREYIEEAAELHELMGAQPEAIQAMRTGLEISDPHLLERFNSQVGVVNGARDAIEVALQALDPDQKRTVNWMGYDVHRAVVGPESRRPRAASPRNLSFPRPR